MSKKAACPIFVKKQLHKKQKLLQMVQPSLTLSLSSLLTVLPRILRFMQTSRPRLKNEPCWSVTLSQCVTQHLKTLRHTAKTHRPRRRKKYAPTLVFLKASEASGTAPMIRSRSMSTYGPVLPNGNGGTSLTHVNAVVSPVHISAQLPNAALQPRVQSLFALQTTLTS